MNGRVSKGSHTVEVWFGPGDRQLVDAAAPGAVGVDGTEDLEVGFLVLLGGVPFQAEDLGEQPVHFPVLRGA